MTTKQPEALRLADELCEAIAEYPEPTALEAQAAAELHRQHARITELEDACRTNIENYEFQRSKADRATATVYQFHYAMKDAGWHPGRTDDDLTQIIRAKGGELASATRHITELESQLAQRFDAADMATASAQGFRNGVASVSAGSEPVATVFTMEALTPGGGVKYHATIHKALPAGTKLYTHPSPASAEGA